MSENDSSFTPVEDSNLRVEARLLQQQLTAGDPAAMVRAKKACPAVDFTLGQGLYSKCLEVVAREKHSDKWANVHLRDSTDSTHVLIRSQYAPGWEQVFAEGKRIYGATLSFRLLNVLNAFYRVECSEGEANKILRWMRSCGYRSDLVVVELAADFPDQDIPGDDNSYVSDFEGGGD